MTSNTMTNNSKLGECGTEQKKSPVGAFLFKYNALIILVALIVVSSLISPVFFTENNIFNVLRQNSALMLCALGMLFVIMTGGIDLAVGSLQGLGGIMIAYLIAYQGFHTPIAGILAVLIAVIVSSALGFGTGVLVAQFRMAPFVATLAMMTIARGLAFIVSNGAPIKVLRNHSAGRELISFGSDSDPLIGLPIPVWIVAIIVVIFFLISKYTSVGRLIMATGSNEIAVRLAGINVKFYQFLVYGISGALSGLAGVIVTARAETGAPVVGSGMELDAIAAVVIGGASLVGGKGSVGNTVIGVLILGLISNIMNLLSVPAYPQQVIKGIIIIGAVLVQGLQNRKTA